MKKFLAVLVAILMILTSVPLAFAAETYEFTQQPAAENGYTAEFSEADATYL